jgi:hypothetical protein
MIRYDLTGESCMYVCACGLCAAQGIRKKSQEAALEQLMLAMPGRLISTNVHVEDLNVTITVFKTNDPSGPLEGAVRVNLYCAKIQANVDVVISAADQIDIVGTLSYPQS